MVAQRLGNIFEAARRLARSASDNERILSNGEIMLMHTLLCWPAGYLDKWFSCRDERGHAQSAEGATQPSPDRKVGDK